MEVDLGQVDIFFQTPCYGQMLFLNYHESMLSTAMRFRELGINFRYVPSGGDSLVQRARNVITAEFLKSPSTHMMIIDADIGWNPDDLLRLIAADKDIACAVYPKKTYPISWPANLFRGSGRIEADPETGFIPIKDAPTGFMLVKRKVIEGLVNAHPEWKCCFREGGPENNEHCYSLFDCFTDPDHGENPMYLSEDFAFCRRARAAGFSVWCDPTIKLSHAGTHIFEGGCMADSWTVVKKDA